MAAPSGLDEQQWKLWSDWLQAQRVLLRELDRDLQAECGISKAEFSILMTLHRAPDGQLRVSDLATSLDWDKGRVAHQLTRMERRHLVERAATAGSAGRRAGVRLTSEGSRTARQAIRRHGRNVRRLFFDSLSDDHRDAIAGWSARTLDRLDPPPT